MAPAGVRELPLKPEGEAAVLSGTAQDGHEPLTLHLAMFTAQTRVAAGLY